MPDTSQTSPDLAAQWKSFDQEKRTRILARMTPEQKSKLRTTLEGASVPEEVETPGVLKRLRDKFMAFTAPTVAGPDERTDEQVAQEMNLQPGYSAKDLQIARSMSAPRANVGAEFVKGALRGGAMLVRHPIQAASSGIRLTGLAAASLPHYVSDPNSEYGKEVLRHQAAARQALHDEITPLREGFEQDPGYTGGQLLGQALVGEGASELARVAMDRTPGSLRRTAQRLVGVGPKAIADSSSKIAEGAVKEADRVRAQNQSATERTLEKRGRVDETNAEAARKAQQDRLDVIRKNREAERQHAADTEAAKAGNEKAFAGQKARVAKQAELDQASKELDQRIDAADKNAKAADDAAWNDWRSKAGGTQVEMKPIVDLIRNQRAQMTPEEVSEFRSILKETRPSEADLTELQRTRNSIGRNLGNTVDYDDLSPDQKANIDRIVESLNLDDVDDGPSTKNATAERIHGWKQQLGGALARGGRSGNVYHAMKQVYSALEKAEEQASEQSGAGDLLKKARKLHADYAAAFRDSPNEPATVASKLLQETSPEYRKEQARARRLEAVAKHDPEIGKLAAHVENLRAGPKALPAEEPVRNIVNPLPEKPTLAKVPDLPEPKPYEEPEAHEAFETPEANLRKMRERMIRDAASRWRQTSQYQIRRLAVSAIGSLVGQLFGHHGIETAGGIYVASEAVPKLIASVVEKPKILAWLSSPTAGDIEALRTIPDIDKVRVMDGLTQVAVDQARSGKTPKISHEVADFLGPKNMALIAAASQPRTPAEAKRLVTEARRNAGPSSPQSSQPAK